VVWDIIFYFDFTHRRTLSTSLFTVQVFRRTFKPGLYETNILINEPVNSLQKETRVSNRPVNKTSWFIFIRLCNPKYVTQLWGYYTAYNIQIFHRSLILGRYTLKTQTIYFVHILIKYYRFTLVFTLELKNVVLRKRLY